MVVPLSLDPGHNDPRSPLYSGPRCGECNSPTRRRVRRCESCREAAKWEAKAEEYERYQRLRREAEAVAGGPPTEDELRRLEPPRT